MNISPLLLIKPGKPLPVEKGWRCKRSGDCCEQSTHVTMHEQERDAIYEYGEKHLTVGQLSKLEWRRSADSGFVDLKGSPCPLLDKSSGKPVCTVHPVRPYNCRRFGCMRPDPSVEPLRMAPHSDVLQFGNIGCSNLRLRLVQSTKVVKEYDRLQAKGRNWATQHGWKA